MLTFLEQFPGQETTPLTMPKLYLHLLLIVVNSKDIEKILI